MLHSAGKFLVTFILAVCVQTALADEASDAVQVLERLWKAKSDDGTATQFVGDSQILRIRMAGQGKDGVVRIETTEAPFRFLQIADPSGFLRSSDSALSCYQKRECVFVSCLFDRACVSSTVVMHDPVYRDPEREGTFYSKQRWAAGGVNPNDIERVTQALRILIRLNAPPQFDPLARE
jgi:hypothetical protein